jgi:hypothetical protein
MKPIERITEKFDNLGQPGVAEQKAIKNVNRFRAAGVLAAKTLLGGGLLTMTALTVSGARNEGFRGAVKAIPSALAAPFHNADGEWDMPLVDFGSDGKKVVVSTGAGTAEIGIGDATSAPATESTPGELPDRSYAEGNLADCDSSSASATETIDEGETIGSLVQAYNPGITSREAALNVAYNEFQELNPKLNPDSIRVGTNVLLPVGCEEL